MKEAYFGELSEMFQKISGKLQMHESIAQNQRNDQLEKFKTFKTMLERLQQQPNPLQRDMQQRIQTQNPLLQQQSMIDQQKFQQQRPIPEASSTSLDSTDGNANGSDSQEEVYQKIKSMKEAYFGELSEMFQKISGKLQMHESFAQNQRNDLLEKFKTFKTMLERLLAFLQLSKAQIGPSIKDKVAMYEKQILQVLNSNRPRKPGSSMQPTVGLPPTHLHAIQQQQPQSQMSQHQQQQPQSQTQNPLLQQQSMIDQQIFQQQRPIPEASSTSLDSTDGNANGSDSQEEVYQKIKSMKEAYFGELSEMFQKISGKLQMHESFAQNQRNDILEKFKTFKTMLERLLAFLQLSKAQIGPSIKDKVAMYEKQILQVLNSNRPRKPGSSMQPTVGLPPDSFACNTAAAATISNESASASTAS